MDITFKYKEKIITTPNLEKKLKRMKISIDDIEIIQKETVVIEEEKDEVIDKKQVIVRSNQDEIRRICYIPLDKRPTIRELFKHHIWNPITKTGIREITEEYLMTMYYEN